jgi:transposase
LFLTTRRRVHAGKAYEYLDVAESHRVNGKVRRSILWSLGRRDQLDPEKLRKLISLLQRLVSPEGATSAQIGDLEIESVREYGVVLAARQLWQELGLEKLLAGLARGSGVLVEEAVFRMVVNRLVEPESKLGLCDYQDEHGQVHRGWQGQVHWPSQVGDVDYHQYLRAMDAIHPHRQAIEDALFARVTDLFSLPLRLVLYDLTSTYFEGDGVCELAEYGYSRDHRDDRSQVVIGLAVTQEGIPITHRVYKGSTADVTTFAPMADELRRRFRLQETVIVADRGMFSQDNVAELQNSGQRYILALRARQQTEGQLALQMALQAGLPRPTDKDSPWQVREVELLSGFRHLVVYSAFKAGHDYAVRARRIKRALADLATLKGQVAKGKLERDRIVERATKILVTHKCNRFVKLTYGKAGIEFRINREEYREQRRHDGIFVLETNHPTLSTDEIVASYRQLQEVERAFRVLKSLVKLRPVFHHRDRRVETHIFICGLAFLIGKLIEQRLRQAQSSLSIAHALERLRELKVVDYPWESFLVSRLTKPGAEVIDILRALGVDLGNPVISVRPQAAA